MRRRLSLLEVVGLLLILVAVGLAWQRNLLQREIPGMQALFDAQTWSAQETGDTPVEPEAPLVDPAVLGDLGEAPPPRVSYPHIVPQEGDAVPKAEHAFRFEGKKYTIAVEVDEQLYWGAVASANRISRIPGETEAEQTAAASRYLAQDPLQAPVIAAVSDQLRAAAKGAGLGRDRYAEFIAKYVQTMPYDFPKLAKADAKNRFPVETLVDGTGVCGDKSILMAALLAHEGYDVALLAFEAENHMAVGIKGPGEHYRESGYLLIESTTPAYVGEIPENFVSGITLTSEALVIPIGTGDLQYQAAKRTAKILAARAGAQPAAKALSNDAKSQRLTVEQANLINARLKTAYDSQFKLSAIEGHEDEFLDSKSAVAWIDKHCWWD